MPNTARLDAWQADRARASGPYSRHVEERFTSTLCCIDCMSGAVHALDPADIQEHSRSRRPASSPGWPVPL